MKIIFATRRKYIPAMLLRIITLSKFSHMAVLLDDNTVIEAAAFKGVVRGSYENFRRQYDRIIIQDVSLPDEEAAIKFLLEQVGKPYDWAAIFGIVFRNGKWADLDSWFCSELVAAAIKAGGLSIFKEDASRIIPQYCWVLNWGNRDGG